MDLDPVPSDSLAPLQHILGDHYCRDQGNWSEVHSDISAHVQSMG